MFASSAPSQASRQHVAVHLVVVDHRFASSKQCFDALQQDFVTLNRFDHVVIGAHFQGRQQESRRAGQDGEVHFPGTAREGPLHLGPAGVVDAH